MFQEAQSRVDLRDPLVGVGVTRHRIAKRVWRVRLWPRGVFPVTEELNEFPLLLGRGVELQRTGRAVVLSDVIPEILNPVGKGAENCL